MAAVRASLVLCCFLSQAPGGYALHLRSDSIADEGQQVGSSLKVANEEIKTDANQNNGKSEYLKSFEESWTSKEMVLINPAVSKVIKQTNELASTLIEQDAMCERKWTANCPDGWISTGAGMCLAPPSYGGACKKSQSFAGHGISQKQQFADACKAPWPCQDDCAEGRDYSTLCPEGWEDDGGGFCFAPTDLKSKCATSYNFAQMDIKMKMELAQTCGFNWKCKIPCVQDYSQACPKDWNPILANPSVCMAPVTYAGVCSFSVNTTLMTPLQKSLFARKCGVEFPCLGGVAVTASAIAADNAGLMPDGPVDANGGILTGTSTASEDSAFFLTRRIPRYSRDISDRFHVPSGPLSA